MAADLWQSVLLVVEAVDCESGLGHSRWSPFDIDQNDKVIWSVSETWNGWRCDLMSGGDGDGHRGSMSGGGGCCGCDCRCHYDFVPWNAISAAA